LNRRRPKRNLSCGRKRSGDICSDSVTSDERYHPRKLKLDNKSLIAKPIEGRADPVEKENCLLKEKSRPRAGEMASNRGAKCIKARVFYPRGKRPLFAGRLEQYRDRKKERCGGGQRARGKAEWAKGNLS